MHSTVLKQIKGSRTSEVLFRPEAHCLIASSSVRSFLLQFVLPELRLGLIMTVVSSSEDIYSKETSRSLSVGIMAHTHNSSEQEAQKCKVRLTYKTKTLS